jgi:hypothetical protein
MREGYAGSAEAMEATVLDWRNARREGTETGYRLQGAGYRVQGTELVAGSRGGNDLRGRFRAADERRNFVVRRPVEFFAMSAMLKKLLGECS